MKPIRIEGGGCQFVARRREPPPTFLGEEWIVTRHPGGGVIGRCVLDDGRWRVWDGGVRRFVAESATLDRAVMYLVRKHVKKSPHPERRFRRSPGPNSGM